MIFFILLMVCGVLCDDYVGYDLKIGRAVDLFANYGDLSQVTQVASTEYDDDEEVITIEPFREQNIRIFTNATSREVDSDLMDQNMTLIFSDTFDELLDLYFQDFVIEGSSKPWKAFMGDWMSDEIRRTFGISYDAHTDNCCYVLAKLYKVHKSVKMDALTQPVAVEKYVKRAIQGLHADDASALRVFMRNYGTHYIDSFVTGNFLYQVFKFKRNGYNLLKAYTKRRIDKRPDDLRFYFSSYFLQHVGDIKIASGNKTIEDWAKYNLKDSRYLYSRPSLLKLYYNPTLAYRLSDRLDNGALLALTLKTLKPVFEDEKARNSFEEIVHNDLQLWEINA